jgi:hypothetical protein
VCAAVDDAGIGPFSAAAMLAYASYVDAFRLTAQYPKPKYELVHRWVMQQIQKYNSSDKRVSLPLLRLHSTATSLPLLQEPADKRPSTWRGVMKAILAALALVTLIASPTFAQSVSTEHWQQTNVSPSSPDFGDNGY